MSVVIRYTTVKEFMNPKTKKILIIAFLVVDVGITIFLTVLAIVMIAMTVGKTRTDIESATGLIGYLQNHPMFYGFAFVVPMFILLAANIVLLVAYARRSGKKEPVKVSDLSKEQREALRKELLKDIEEENNR